MSAGRHKDGLEDGEDGGWENGIGGVKTDGWQNGMAGRRENERVARRTSEFPGGLSGGRAAFVAMTLMDATRRQRGCRPAIRPFGWSVGWSIDPSVGQSVGCSMVYRAVGLLLR